jgi:hypothetical protein
LDGGAGGIDGGGGYGCLITNQGCIGGGGGGLFGDGSGTFSGQAALNGGRGGEFEGGFGGGGNNGAGGGYSGGGGTVNPGLGKCNGGGGSYCLYGLSDCDTEYNVGAGYVSIIFQTSSPPPPPPFNGLEFTLACEVMMNDLNRYPFVLVSSTDAFELHGTGPEYGSLSGRLGFYLYTTLGFGPYGRGLSVYDDNNVGRDDGALYSQVLSLGTWHTVHVQKFLRSVTLTVDNVSVSAQVAPDAPEFRMRDPGLISSGSDPAWVATADPAFVLHGEVRNMVISAL